jgi:hypothetical protein
MFPGTLVRRADRARLCPFRRAARRVHAGRNACSRDRQNHRGTSEKLLQTHDFRPGGGARRVHAQRNHQRAHCRDFDGGAGRSVAEWCAQKNTWSSRFFSLTRTRLLS